MWNASNTGQWRRRGCAAVRVSGRGAQNCRRDQGRYPLNIRRGYLNAFDRRGSGCVLEPEQAALHAMSFSPARKLASHAPVPRCLEADRRRLAGGGTRLRHGPRAGGGRQQEQRNPAVRELSSSLDLAGRIVTVDACTPSTRFLSVGQSGNHGPQIDFSDAHLAESTRAGICRRGASPRAPPGDRQRERPKSAWSLTSSKLRGSGTLICATSPTNDRCPYVRPDRNVAIVRCSGRFRYLPEANRQEADRGTRQRRAVDGFVRDAEFSVVKQADQLWLPDKKLSTTVDISRCLPPIVASCRGNCTGQGLRRRPEFWSSKRKPKLDEFDASLW